MKHVNLPVPILNHPPSTDKSDRQIDRQKEGRKHFVICFMRGTKEVWKFSVVIREGKEEQEEGKAEEEEEMAAFSVMGMA